MLKNYFKIAIAVLKRRKFFTFISLFGISITLTILMVLIAFVDYLVGTTYPDYKRSRSLYVNILKQQDSKHQGASTGPISFYFLNTYVSTLKTPEKVAIGSIFRATNTYIRDKKLTLDLKYTNAAFWDVLDFKFLEGKPYNDAQIQRGELVAVITEKARREYFGNESSVVGKYIETDNIKYRVAGVVKGTAITQIIAYADIFVPYTLPKSNYQSKSFMGSYSAVILARSPSDIPKIQQEFRDVVKKIPMEGREFDQLYCEADKYLEGFTRLLFGDSDDSGKGTFLLIIILFVTIFMLLPTLNLVNINISRILERASEIGVRKAFGASTKKLVLQFIIENIILTLLGGLIAVILSLILIYVLNSSGWIPNLALSLNVTVLLIALCMCLVFGFISGVYPAWRMSRMQVVEALKSA